MEHVVKVGSVADAVVEPGVERPPVGVDERAAAQLRERALIVGLERLPVAEGDAHQVLQAQRCLGKGRGGGRVRGNRTTHHRRVA